MVCGAVDQKGCREMTILAVKVNADLASILRWIAVLVWLPT